MILKFSNFSNFSKFVVVGWRRIGYLLCVNLTSQDVVPSTLSPFISIHPRD